MIVVSTLLSFSLAVASDTQAPAAARLKSESTVLQAAAVELGDGTVFKPGVVIVLDGRIVAVGPAPPLPAGSRVVDCGEGVITPGLIDAACQLGTYTTQGFAEDASEVIPHLDVADAIDLYAKDFEQLAREGVTTVYVTGEAASVISARGAAVKTGGPIAGRKLAAKPCVKGTIGPESSGRGSFNLPPNRFNPPTIYQRRPTTRMGAAWVFREAFLDALAFRDGKKTNEDPDALKALVDVMNGTTALRMQAREALDIHSAARLCDEFGLKFTLEYAIEAGACLDMIKERNIPVIFGPVRSADSSVTGYDDGHEGYETPKRLAEIGVPFCLTACDGIGDGGLARQAGLAVRHGLDRGRALRAVTADAAAMLGLEKKVGRIAEGLDADLVLWNGPPLDDASRPVLVLIGGRPVYDADQKFRKENS